MNATSQWRRQSPHFWRRFASLPGLMLAGCLPVAGQWATVDSNFPEGDGPDSYVSAVAVDSAGRTFIAGYFTTVSGIPQSNLARVNTDGSLDIGFVPRINGQATRIQPLGNGRVLISGSFSQLNGSSVPGIARLLEDGSTDPGFVLPMPSDSYVTYLSMAAPDGSVWITGGFSNLAGANISGIARLLPDGSLDPQFASPFSPGQSVDLHGTGLDGKAIVSGSFTNLGGYPVRHLARLNPDGSVDPSFVSGLGPAERVSRALLRSDGSLVAAVVTVVQSEYGYEYARGPTRLVRLHSDGALDTKFAVYLESPGVFLTSSVHTLVEQPDGKILISGTFLRANGVARGKLARLHVDGTLDHCFDVAFSGEWSPLSIAAGPSESIIVGGSFQGLGDQRKPNLLRLVPQACGPGVISMGVSALEGSRAAHRVVVPLVRKGGIDREQAVSFFTRDITAIAGIDYAVTSGMVKFAPGERSQFISIPISRGSGMEEPKMFEVYLHGPGMGNLTNTLVTLVNAPAGSAGAADTNYVVKLDGRVNQIITMPGGQAFIAGYFTNVNGQFCPNIARLNADGSRDTAFNRSHLLNGEIRDIALDASGRLLVAGYFSHVDGIFKPGLARLKTNGSLDVAFKAFEDYPTNIYAGTFMYAVKVLPDQRVVCFGEVPQEGAEYSEVVRLWKLNPDGGLDDSFTNVLPVTTSAYRLEHRAGGGLFQVTRGLGATVTALKSDGALDKIFVPPADRQFTFYNGSIEPLPDGRVSVAGASGLMDGLPGIVPLWRLNPDGSLDSSFSPGSLGPFGKLDWVETHQVGRDGRVLVAGGFAESGFIALMRLHADGSPDLSFDQGRGFIGSSAHVSSLEALPESGWLMGGEFAGYDGFNQKNLIRILPETIDRPRAFLFNIANVALRENATNVTFEVRRRGDALEPATVTVLTVNGSATAGEDYVAMTTNLLFGVGEWSKTLSVELLQDSAVEPLEQFTLVLSNPSPSFTLEAPSTIAISIENDDAAVEFISPGFEAVEEDGFARVAVKWSGALTAGLEAQIHIVPMTDQSEDPSSLTVKLGGPTRTTNWFRIPIRDTAEKELSRRYRLEVHGKENVSPGPQAEAELIVHDLDYATTPARGVAGVVYAVTGSPDGGVYLAGDFTGVHGMGRTRVARLQPNGEVDSNFDPGLGPDRVVHAAAVQADGKLVIAGWFTSVSGVPRAGVARLNTDGTLDTSFNCSSGATSTNGSPFITSLLPWHDGTLFAAGQFTHFNDRYSPTLVRIGATGLPDPEFSSPFRHPFLSWPWVVPGVPPVLRTNLASPTLGMARSLAERDGNVLVSGRMNLAADGSSVSLAGLSPAGQPQFVFRGGETVYALAAAPDGDIFTGESSGSSWLPVRKIGTNGITNPAFEVRNLPSLSFASATVHQLLLQPDGRLLCCALLYQTLRGLPFSRPEDFPGTAVIARLLPDGQWDPSFEPVHCAMPLFEQDRDYWMENYPLVRWMTPQPPLPTTFLSRQPDGVLIVVGGFDFVNGEVRRRLARMESQGALRGVLSMRLQLDGGSLRLLLPGEVEAPYLLETSTDMRHWSPWLRNDYPWWPVDFCIPSKEPSRFFRVRAQN